MDKDFKLRVDPENEHQIFKEMSINIDLMNDKLPSTEELMGRTVEDSFSTDRDTHS